MYRTLLLLFFICFIACKSDSSPENPTGKFQDTTAFKKRIEISSFDLPLDTEARKFALKWLEYITAQNEIQKLEGATVAEIMNNADVIAQIMKSLQESVPDSLKSMPVEARLNVVNTKAQLLKQYAAKKKPDAEAISQTAKDLHLEFNNLKLQMNELFLKSLEDFEKELDEFEEMERQGEPDSLESTGPVLQNLQNS